MSAIWGIHWWDPGRRDPKPAATMEAALAPFSPDGSNSAVFPAWLGFGKKCLTPQDHLETQPMVCDRGRFVLVADARLDGRDKLKNALGRDGEATTDSALILESFVRWGPDCVHHLTGEFAIAVFDKITETFFCARDHVGQAPFFFSFADGVFAFASAVRALKQLSGICAGINYAELARHTVGLDVTSQDTMWTGVQELLPGHRMHVDSDGCRIGAYWFWPRDTLNLQTDDGYKAVLLETADSAVADRLRLNGHPGMFLSGGLDSSTTTSLALRHVQRRGGRLQSFTYVPESGETSSPAGRIADERGFVEDLVAAKSGLDSELVTIGATRFDHRLAEFFDLSGGIYIHGFFNRLWYEKILARAAARDCALIMDSGAGNHTLSTSGQAHFGELARTLRLRALVREAKGWGRESGESWYRVAVRLGLIPSLPGGVQQWIARRRIGQHFKNPFVRPAFLEAHGLQGESLLERRGHDPLERRWNSLRYSRRTGPARRAWEAMYRVRPVDVTLDRRLVELCFRLPMRLFVRDGVDRSLIRAATLGLIPDSIRLNTRRGYQGADWVEIMRREIPCFRRWLRYWQGIPEVRDRLDLQRMEQALDKFGSVDPSVLPQIGMYRIYLTQAMLVAHMIDPPPTSGTGY